MTTNRGKHAITYGLFTQYMHLVALRSETRFREIERLAVARVLDGTDACNTIRTDEGVIRRYCMRHGCLQVRYE